MKAHTLKRRLVSKKNQASLKSRRFHFTIGYKKPKTTPAFDGKVFETFCHPTLLPPLYSYLVKTGEERRRQERRERGMEGLRNVLFEKMKEAEGALKGIKDAKLASSLRDKLEQTKGVTESMQGTLSEKLPQLLQFSSRKVKEAEGAVKSYGELISEPLKEKLPLLSQLWGDVVGFLVGKLDGVLPAAASPEALRILVQLVLATILLHLTLVFLGYCLNGAFNTIGFVASIVIKDFTYCLKGAFKMVTYPASLFRRCCCFFFREAGKTMKAPGRKGLRIPRATFECDPKRYFLDLRANAPMEAPRRPSKKLCLALVFVVAVVVISVSAL